MNSKQTLLGVEVLRKPDNKEVTTVLKITDSDSVLRELVGKEQYDEYRSLWKKASTLQYVSDYPLQLDFELNYSCNYSCHICTWAREIRGDKNRRTWFDLAAFKEVIDEGVKKGLKAIRLNFLNEPLMRPDIVDFVSYARKAGVLDVYFSTNGSLLTKKIAEGLIESGLTRLQVSLDATTEETYSKIRQGGKLANVVSNIHNFLEIRRDLKSKTPLLRVNFVKTRDNEYELKDFIEYWKTKVDLIGIQDYININNPVLSETAFENMPKFNCAQSFCHLTVRYNGEILPCCTFFGAELPIAKLKTKIGVVFSDVTHFASATNPKDLPLMTIEEAWKCPKIDYLRKMHIAGEYYKHPVCKKCVMSTSHLDVI